MSDGAQFSGIAALLCGAYLLYGGYLERLWGVDPSRMTPAIERGKRGGGLLTLLYMLACAVLGGLFGLAAVQRFGRDALPLIVFSGVLIMAPMNFALLFVSVRHEGKGMSAVGEGLIGPIAKHVMRVLMALAAAGLILGLRRPALAFAALCLPQAFWLSEVIAPRIRSEAHICPAAFGGAMLYTAAACAGALWLADTQLLTDGVIAPYANALSLMASVVSLALCAAWMKHIGRQYGVLIAVLVLLLLSGAGLMLV